MKLLKAFLFSFLIGSSLYAEPYTGLESIVAQGIEIEAYCKAFASGIATAAAVSIALPVIDHYTFNLFSKTNKKFRYYVAIAALANTAGYIVGKSVKNYVLKQNQNKKYSYEK